MSIRELVKIRLDQIKVGEQPRTLFELAETEALAESLRELGLQQPVLVRQENGHYVLVAGERRVRAAQLLGWKDIDALVDVDLSTQPQIEVLKRQIAENAQRVGLHALDEARSFVRLYREEQMGPTEIAKLVGKDQSTVSNTIRWYEQATPEMHELIARGWEPSKAVTLLPLVLANPEVANRVALIAFQSETPKSKLGGLPFWEELRKSGLIHVFNDDYRDIDYKTICPGCPAFVTFDQPQQWGTGVYKRQACLRAKTGYLSQVAAKEAEAARQRAETLAALGEEQRAALAAQAQAAQAQA
ncbi:MAG TPA: ParB/RepB/Spo0J family partition protein, partial [Phenylobacterium sp.]